MKYFCFYAKKKYEYCICEYVTLFFEITFSSHNLHTIAHTCLLCSFCVRLLDTQQTAFKRTQVFKIFRQIKSIIHGCRCLITVISSDNNRKASDVRSFHPAVTPTGRVGALENEHFYPSPPRLCLTQRLKPPACTRRRPPPPPPFH